MRLKFTESDMWSFFQDGVAQTLEQQPISIKKKDIEIYLKVKDVVTSIALLAGKKCKFSVSEGDILSTINGMEHSSTYKEVVKNLPK